MSNSVEYSLLQHCYFLLSILEKMNLEFWLIKNEPIGECGSPADYDCAIWFDNEKSGKSQKILNLHKRCLEINPKLSDFFKITTDDFNQISDKIKKELWD